jgi:hypothetical protein
LTTSATNTNYSLFKDAIALGGNVQLWVEGKGGHEKQAELDQSFGNMAYRNFKIEITTQKAKALAKTTKNRQASASSSKGRKHKREKVDDSGRDAPKKKKKKGDKEEAVKATVKGKGKAEMNYSEELDGLDSSSEDDSSD